MKHYPLAISRFATYVQHYCWHTQNTTKHTTLHTIHNNSYQPDDHGAALQQVLPVVAQLRVRGERAVHFVELSAHVVGAAQLAQGLETLC